MNKIHLHMPSNCMLISRQENKIVTWNKIIDSTEGEFCIPELLYVLTCFAKYKPMVENRCKVFPLVFVARA